MSWHKARGKHYKKGFNHPRVGGRCQEQADSELPCMKEKNQFCVTRAAN